MKRYGLLFMCVFLVACMQTPTPEHTEEMRPSPTVTVTRTATPSPTITATNTPTPTPTNTPSLTPSPTATRYTDNSLNCPGSVALMYHGITPSAFPSNGGYGLNTDLRSFEKVLEYLVQNNYYFPTPEEFATDISLGVCRHKYAILTIDDSWNDPVDMGVTDILRQHGGGEGEGKPSVWFGVITRMLAKRKSESGDAIDPWIHLLEMQETNLVHIVSHSQTHPVYLVNIVDVYDSANDAVYGQIASELSPSKQDIMKYLGREPLFFIYPGGNVSNTVVRGMPGNYVGAFSVTPGGLDKAFPYFLPRINGGMLCEGKPDENYICVIKMIENIAAK